MSENIKKIERKYLPEIVYGSMDGAITTFAVVSGVSGASLNSSIILILGFANMFADGFSMAISNFFSTKSKNEISKKYEKNATKSAIVTFIAFFISGLIPLLSFLIASITKDPFFVRNQFKLSFVFTSIALLIVGWFKGVVTEKHKYKSSIQTFLIGSIAALLAFCIGYLLNKFIRV
ncbi:MAG: VIT1/CCC1 transporter family protein [Candidatus Pacearchaeota archaeon]